MSARRLARTVRTPSPPSAAGSGPAVLELRQVDVWCAPQYADHPYGSIPAWHSAQQRYAAARRWWMVSHDGYDERYAAARSFSLDRRKRSVDAELAADRAAAEEVIAQRASATGTADVEAP